MTKRVKMVTGTELLRPLIEFEIYPLVGIK